MLNKGSVSGPCDRMMFTDSQFKQPSTSMNVTVSRNYSTYRHAQCYSTVCTYEIKTTLPAVRRTQINQTQSADHRPLVPGPLLTPFCCLKFNGSVQTRCVRQLSLVSSRYDGVKQLPAGCVVSTHVVEI